VIDELASADFVEHQSGMGTTTAGSKAAIGDLHRTFPDLTYKLINSIVQDDLVTVHYQASGTHTGPLGPMPPSGKAFTTDVIDIMRFRDGQLVEHWGVPDRLSLMEQLGFWPPK
jgi:predicted ester cyclase